MVPLRDWGSFYVIVGSAAAALIGLQFVAMALVADLPRPASNDTLEAFGTPTTMHFSACLFVAAVLSAPWRSLAFLALMLGALGAAGFVYSLIIARRARNQPDYQPVLEDWMFHVILPAIVYGTIAVGGYLLRADLARGLVAIAAATLTLMFIAIHNVWDTVTYLVVLRKEEHASTPPAGEGR
jgi:hypothetical protein